MGRGAGLPLLFVLSGRIALAKTVLRDGMSRETLLRHLAQAEASSRQRLSLGRRDSCISLLRDTWFKAAG